MKQDTSSKFAAILAAAQAKANAQATPKFIAPAPKQEEKPNPHPEPTPEPQASPLQELSTMTVESLLNEPSPVYCAPMTFEMPSPKEPAFKIVDYSPKSFAILTASKPAEDILNIFRQHGTYQPFLKCGKGWIFSKRHLPAIKQKLGLK